MNWPYDRRSWQPCVCYTQVIYTHARVARRMQAVAIYLKMSGVIELRKSNERNQQGLFLIFAVELHAHNVWEAMIVKMAVMKPNVAK